MAQSIKKNFLYNILLNISSFIFPLITAPYISRVLEPNGVGLFNFANTYAGYFCLFASLGIPIYGVREIAKVRDSKEDIERLTSELITIAGIMTVVVSLIYVISLSFFEKLTSNYVTFFVAGFGIYFTPFKISWVLQGLEEFKYITLRTLIIRVLCIVSLFAFVRTKNDLLIYILINILGTILADVWNFIKVWSEGYRFKIVLKGLKRHISPLLILFSSTIASSIYTMLDTLMLGFMRDYVEVGYYNTASHLSKVILTLVTSLSVVAIPRVSYYAKTGDIKNANLLVNKSFSFVAFLGIPIAVGLMCIAPVFTPWFFGDQYYGAILPLQITSFLIVAIGLSNIAGVQVLVGYGLDKLFLYAILAGTVSNFTLNLLLIPTLGSVGASVASVVSEILVTIGMVIMMIKFTPIRFNIKLDFIKSLVGSSLFIVLSIIVYHIIGYSFLSMIIIIVASFLVYIVTQTLMKHSSMKIAVDNATAFINHFNSK